MTDLLPCPFCGESLVEKHDHHGKWWAHRREPGPCAISHMQIFDDEDAAEWNRRPVCEWRADLAAWDTGCRVNIGIGVKPPNYCPNCGGKVEVMG